MTDWLTPPSSANDILKIKLSKIQAESVPTVGWRTGRFFVSIKFNEDAATSATTIADSTWVFWEDEFHFDIPVTSTMTLTLCATHRVRADSIVGWNVEKMNPSLWSGKSAERPLRNETGVLNTRINFTVELLSQDAASAPERQKAANIRAQSEFQDVQVGDGMQFVAGAALYPVHIQGAELHTRHVVWSPHQHVGSPLPAAAAGAAVGADLGLGEIDDMSETWDTLINHVNVFTSLVTRFSEVHPYAKVACSVLLIAQKMAIAQKEQDERFRKLINITSETFGFLNKLKIAALEGHLATIKCLTVETTECAYFIRDYTSQNSFVIRAAKNVVSGSAIEGKIAQYEKKFEDLKQAFRDGSALSTEMTVVRIAEQVDRIAAAGELDDLPYASGACYDIGKQCLSGTREHILGKIFDWVNDADARVLVLAGAAGTGKSAIAATVSKRFDELRKLGSSFLFLPEKPERSPDLLFSTITRDLADLDPEWKEALKQNIGPRAQRKTASIQAQFERFILDPAAHPPFYFGPVVIVIDGLDACQDRAARKVILSLLSSRAVDLPPNFRILITARPEPDISAAFAKHEDIVWWDMDKVIDEKANSHDISAFFSSELAGVTGLKWSDRSCRKMTAKADGDFGWAAFACDRIKDLSATGTPADRMAALLANPKGYESGAECEDALPFLHGRLRDKMHFPHSGSRPSSVHGHQSRFDHFFHPGPPKWPDAPHGFRLMPPPPCHGQGPPGPWHFPGSNDRETCTGY